MFYVDTPSKNKMGEIFNENESTTNPENLLRLKDDFNTSSDSPLVLGSPTTPVPPPRNKRRGGLKKLENIIVSDEEDNENVCGYLSMPVTSAIGLRQKLKQFWFVFDYNSGHLCYYRSEEDANRNELLGEIDIVSATFFYDVENDTHGQFNVCTKDGDVQLSAGTSENRLYWLQQLQKSRRFCANRCKHIDRYNQIGLWNAHSSDCVSMASSFFDDKKCEALVEDAGGSGFHLFQSVEKPKNIDYFASHPKSADYNKRPTSSFFPSFGRGRSYFNNIHKSVSMCSSISPLTSQNLTSPPTFQALSKMRKSFRSKRDIPVHSYSLSSSPNTLARQLSASRADLEVCRDEVLASKEVNTVLQKHILALEKERESWEALHDTGFSEETLMNILRTKDAQIIELESEIAENRKIIDHKNCKLEQIDIYKQLIEAKDETIVRLTNKLHEVELIDVISSSDSNCIIVDDSSKDMAGEKVIPKFREFVNVGIQTTKTQNQDTELLRDTVVAYESQNRFLNKEVLELNQLRQAAQNREQKFYIDASDWEAKFIQIQSKYLLLLNELHNPQVCESISRQEMVAQLIQDIVEAAETPKLSLSNSAFDQFGFRIEVGSATSNGNHEAAVQNNSGNDISLETKAEILLRVAESKAQDTSKVSSSPESVWEETIVSLSGKSPFYLTADIKKLLRSGIPIKQRGAVWKAIVDHRIRRWHSPFNNDYYRKMLSNYNPSRHLTTAAKQIELDLLRTLPQNKHYDSPHADGIAKLRRVLLAYSVHNPDVEYCQGFNRIAAIALLFMNEEDAFWCLLYIVEHVMPSEYYSRDKQLIGAQVDQKVLWELLAEKLPRLSNHFTLHGVDTTLFSLNWFLCVFVDSVPVKLYLHIWDSFLFEGSKVLFRYALAIFKFLEESLLLKNDYMSIFNKLRAQLNTLDDIPKITQIAFHDLNPFPMRSVTNKREHHYKLVEAQKRELDKIRQNYRKNSIVHGHQALIASQSTIEKDDESMEMNSDDE